MIIFFFLYSLFIEAGAKLAVLAWMGMVLYFALE
jgi:hypothetical protein